MWDAAAKDRARGTNNQLSLPVREMLIILVSLPFKSNRKKYDKREEEGRRSWLSGCPLDLDSVKEKITLILVKVEWKTLFRTTAVQVETKREGD